MCCAGNGFIEGEELNAFLKEFIASVNSDDNMQVNLSFNALTFNKNIFKVSEEVFEDLKGTFMDVYDDNKDGKIDIREMAQLLPMEENFLLLFRFDNPLDSSVEFMKV